MGLEVKHSRLKKSPPIMSHEWVRENHGDIISCVIMLVMLGLVFQVTSPIAQLFIVPQYNQTLPDTNDPPEQRLMYQNGPKDFITVFFYSMAIIAANCAVQEYIFDKVSKKLHLSRTKQVKFNESGQLFLWSLYSVVHTVMILNDLSIHKNMWQLWSGYPEAHRIFPLSIKLFYIFQISYWLHQFPEFYLQKLKRNEILGRLLYVLIFLISTSFFYFSNFNRLGLVLLFFEYFSQTIFHISRLLYFSEKVKATIFKPWNILFPIIRLATIVITVLTLWYGFRSHATLTPYLNFSTGNWNTDFIRINLLILVAAVQMYALFTFTMFHIRRIKEQRHLAGIGRRSAAGGKSSHGKKKSKSDEGSKKHN